MANKFKGFTLVEMAVVLVIIGLLVSAGLGVGNAQMQMARITTTKQKEDAIKSALISFIARNNRLPCPAVAGLAPGAVGYGVEALIPGTCTNTFQDALPVTVVTGVLPWSSLGITDESASDGYYNRFTYQVKLSATNTNSQTIAGLNGIISTHLAAPAVLATSPASLVNHTNLCVSTAFNPCSSVAIIVSHGQNGFGAFSPRGIQVPTAGAGADELENIDNDSKFVIKEFSSSATNPFDDIVLPLTPPDLLSPLTTRGSMDDYRAALNKNFTAITSAIIAKAVDKRTGNSYPISIPIQTPIPTPIPSTSPTVGPFDTSLLSNATLIDPWGANITYQRYDINNPLNPALLVNNTTQMKVISSTTPSFIAFTLTSNGPDGVSGTSDDITSTIYVSQLMSVINNSVW